MNKRISIIFVLVGAIVLGWWLFVPKDYIKVSSSATIFEGMDYHVRYDVRHHIEEDTLCVSLVDAALQYHILLVLDEARSGIDIPSDDEVIDKVNETVKELSCKQTRLTSFELYKGTHI